MSLGFPTPATPGDPGATDPEAGPSRMLTPVEWADAGIPPLRGPRQTVTALYDRHVPLPTTATIAVLDPDERLVASASFRVSEGPCDGWRFRNAILAQLRRVIPHDLRRRTPVRTAVLLLCREGATFWTVYDGAWMWGLRDACSLHGLRCGAYVVMTGEGWQVQGEGRSGRRPRVGSPSRLLSVPKPRTARSRAFPAGAFAVAEPASVPATEVAPTPQDTSAGHDDPAAQTALTSHAGPIPQSSPASRETGAPRPPGAAPDPLIPVAGGNRQRPVPPAQTPGRRPGPARQTPRQPAPLSVPKGVSGSGHPEPPRRKTGGAG